MRIRCERCATVYELDEKRLPARGAQVKCTRCQHVFRATPPGQTLPAQTPPVEPAAADAPRPVPTEERTAVFDFSRGTTPERTASYVTAPPPAPASAVGTAGSAAPADPQGPSHPRVAQAAPVAAAPSARWPLFLLVLILLAVALAAAWFATRKRGEPTAVSRAGTLQSLLARDDRSSLEQAAFRPSGEEAGDGATFRSLAMLWLAADAREELAPIRARVLALEAQALQEGEARAPGWERRRDEITLRLADARREAAPIEERERALLAASVASEGTARSSGASPISLLRVKAVRQATLADPALGLTVREAATIDASDPWVEMARSLASDRGEVDLDALGSLSARHPRLLRARLLLARGLHSAGREGDALRVIDEVLAENGEHETAKLLKAEILAPPRAAVSRVETGGGEPPTRPGGYLPRLKPRS